MPPRYDYAGWPKQSLGEETTVACPYCGAVAVEVRDVGDDWFEGDCGACGQNVEFDYDPRGVTGYENGLPVRKVE